MRDVIRRTIELDRKDVKWFEETFPNASLQGVIGMLLEKFRAVNEFTPAHYAEVAAKALSEELRK